MTDHTLLTLDAEPDPRPLPDDDTARIAASSAFDMLSDLFSDTRLEDDLSDLLWSMVGAFHRRVEAFDRDLDTNEQDQRRNAFEAMREHAAAHTRGSRRAQRRKSFARIISSARRCQA